MVGGMLSAGYFFFANVVCGFFLCRVFYSFGCVFGVVFVKSSQMRFLYIVKYSLATMMMEIVKSSFGWMIMKSFFKVYIHLFICYCV